MNELDEARENAEARRLLEQLPGVVSGAEARVALRVARARRAPPAVRPAVWVGGAMALAAAALFAVWSRAEPEVAPLTELTAGAWHTGRLEGIDLTYFGSGQVQGSPTAPRVEWQSGTLHVEVEPNRGLDLRVATREAEVHVVGTGFTVERSALGTHVSVRHGRVETTCVGGQMKLMQAGDERLCAPTTAAGLLGRANALVEAGSDVGLVIEAADAGLAKAKAGSPVVGELLTVRVRALADAGRLPEALEAARLALANPDAAERRTELVALASGMAVASGGCSVAAPWLITAVPEAEAACSE